MQQNLLKVVKSLLITGTIFMLLVPIYQKPVLAREEQGEIVIGEDGVHSDRWFRIRHNNQSGYVHARYVRDLSVSKQRIDSLAAIARQELLIQSKIDGWQIDFSLETQNKLREILNDAHALQVGNWQFDFNYSELNHILQSSSYDHISLITLFRYNLINDIVELEREIENNIHGSLSTLMENYTEASWEQMYDALMEAQALLNEGWQYNLSDEEVDSAASDFNLEQTLLFAIPTLMVLAVAILILKIIKFVHHRRFSE